MTSKRKLVLSAVASEIMEAIGVVVTVLTEKRDEIEEVSV
jgi:hypothetical protein